MVLVALIVAVVIVSFGKETVSVVSGVVPLMVDTPVISPALLTVIPAT